MYNLIIFSINSLFSRFTASKKKSFSSLSIISILFCY